MNFSRFHKQTGATLMEVLIAMTISLVVTAAMIAMMSNSLGTTARIIHMTKLTDDMRIAMQMMSRDVRRSSYNANSMYCYGNYDCDSDGSDLTLAGDVVITDAGDCFTFLTDRDHNGNSIDNDAGGFRHVIKNSVGVIQMWTGDNTPDCTDDTGAPDWVDITDSDQMDIFAFTVGDEGYTQEVLNNGAIIINQKVRKIRMDMEGRLVLDDSITRHVEDVITIRNDLLL